MKGIFDLKTADDLFAKIKWEYENLSSDPTNSYVAYNFFVTAWHLLEWLYPDEQIQLKQKTNPKRKPIREKYPILQVCEHLAVGAKHFKPGDPNLKSVTNTGHIGHWPEEHWHPHHWPEGHWIDFLYVELTDKARDQFGLAWMFSLSQKR